jgi:hypothetical protein
VIIKYQHKFQVKDNWKHAHLKGVSSLHVLDKFSIALQFDRRVLHTADPNWPSLVITGTLPKLVVHVNEDKVFALERMASLLIGDAEDHYTSTTSTAVQATDLLAEEDLVHHEDVTLFSEWKPAPDVDESSKLMLVQGGIHQSLLKLDS